MISARSSHRRLRERRPRGSLEVAAAGDPVVTKGEIGHHDEGGVFVGTPLKSAVRGLNRPPSTALAKVSTFDELELCRQPATWTIRRVGACGAEARLSE
jgi:hypothetical protein